MTVVQPIVQQAAEPRDDRRASGFFLLIAPLLFAAYALLTPPFHVFDENQHLYRAWQISSLKLTADRHGRQSGGELPPGLATATLREIGSVVPQSDRRAVVRPFSEIFSWNTAIGVDQAPIFYNFFGAAVYSPAGYAPQVLSVHIGTALGLSVEWTLRLGRLLNCALCIGLIWWALTLIPFGRWVMATIALLPPTAAGAASFGQDGLVIGGGFLLTAMGLKIAVEARWSICRMVIVGLAGIAVTLSKGVYLPLIAVAALPKPPGITWPRWLSPPVLLTVISAFLLAVWMRANSHSVVVFLPELPSVSEQVSWMIANPIEFAALVARTYIVLLPGLWAGLYRFGDSTVPIDIFAAFAGTAAIFLIMVHGERSAVQLTRIRRAWMLCVFAALAVLIATALFVSFTPRGNFYIPGIQARYLLPALPLAGIALMRRGGEDSQPLIPAALTFAVIANIFTLGTILRTFYTF